MHAVHAHFLHDTFLSIPQCTPTLHNYIISYPYPYTHSSSRIPSLHQALLMRRLLINPPHITSFHIHISHATSLNPNASHLVNKCLLLQPYHRSWLHKYFFQMQSLLLYVLVPLIPECLSFKCSPQISPILGSCR